MRSVEIALERRTARPQAAGTGRYHLPFNVADETGDDSRSEIRPTRLESCVQVVASEKEREWE